jgi:hypothetical protein
MPPLADIQSTFLDSLFTGGNAGAEALVVPGDIGAARRLDIYRHNARSNWRSALQAVYPVVLALVGEPFFNEAADRFADAEPSRSGDLRCFGGGFAAFLAGYPHAGELAYLPDVARLEWAWHESFHAAEHAVLEVAKLALVAPDRYGDLLFGLHPSVRLVRSDFPALAIWRANQEGFKGDGRVDLGAGGEHVLVFRGDGETRLFALERADWQFLHCLERGLSLEETAGQEGLDGDAAFPGEALARWVGEGVIVSFSLPALEGMDR